MFRPSRAGPGDPSQHRVIVKAIARQAAMLVVVVALVLVLTVELRRAEQMPTPPPAIAWIVTSPPPPQTTAGCSAVGFPGRRPQKTVGAQPVYPAAARQAHVTGVVIVVAEIDERGNVVNPRVVRSIPMLDRAALEAVRKWKFSPATIHGVPSCVSMTLAVSFAEPREPREPSW